MLINSHHHIMKSTGACKSYIRQISELQRKFSKKFSIFQKLHEHNNIKSCRILEIRLLGHYYLFATMKCYPELMLELYDKIYEIE